MCTTESQITSVSFVCSTVRLGADQRKHQSSAPLAFVRGIHQWPVASLHKRPITRKMFPRDGVIMPWHDGLSDKTVAICVNYIWNHVISRQQNEGVFTPCFSAANIQGAQIVFQSFYFVNSYSNVYLVDLSYQRELFRMISHSYFLYIDSFIYS